MLTPTAGESAAHCPSLTLDSLHPSHADRYFLDVRRPIILAAQPSQMCQIKGLSRTAWGARRYSIIVNGIQQVVGGTSAVAPMWAAWKGLTDTVAGRVLPFSAASVYECAPNWLLIMQPCSCNCMQAYSSARCNRCPVL